MNIVDENGLGTGVYAVTGDRHGQSSDCGAHRRPNGQRWDRPSERLGLAPELDRPRISAADPPRGRAGRDHRPQPPIHQRDLASSALNQQTVPATSRSAISNEDPRFAARGDSTCGDSPPIDGGEFTTLSDEPTSRTRPRPRRRRRPDRGDLGAFEYQGARRRRPSQRAGTAGPGPTVGVLRPDPGDGQGFAYSWSFGDGGTASGIAPQHVYAASGEHTVTPYGHRPERPERRRLEDRLRGRGAPRRRAAWSSRRPRRARHLASARAPKARASPLPPLRAGPRARFASARTGKRVRVLRLDGRRGSTCASWAAHCVRAVPPEGPGAGRGREPAQAHASSCSLGRSLGLAAPQDAGMPHRNDPSRDGMLLRMTSTTRLFRLAIAVIGLHIADDNFLQPEAGTSAGDHLVSGLVPLALLALAAWGFPRLPGAGRGALALFLGPLGIATGIEAVHYANQVGPSGDDFTGFLAIPAGLLLIALGALTLWRTRRTEGNHAWRYAPRPARRHRPRRRRADHLPDRRSPTSSATPPAPWCPRTSSARPTRTSRSRPATASRSRAGTCPRRTAPP